jgi:hypothetical protein
MKRHIPTFEQFVLESTDADGFNPQNASQADVKVKEIKTLEELIPGKEYILTIDGKENNDMVYQGVTDGYYVFNEEDHNSEPVTFDEAEIAELVSKGSISQVAM